VACVTARRPGPSLVTRQKGTNHDTHREDRPTPAELRCGHRGRCGGARLCCLWRRGNDGGGGEGEITTQIDCERFEEFGDLQGTTVSVYTSIVEPEAVSHMASYEPFEGGFPPE